MDLSAINIHKFYTTRLLLLFIKFFYDFMKATKEVKNKLYFILFSHLLNE
jgi:hypothetical protein